MELSFIRAGEHDRLEVRVDGLKGDLLVAPGVALLRLLAPVPLDGVALSGLRVGRVAKLDENGLALARALDGSSEEAPGTVVNRGFHGLADHLGDEHARAQTMARLNSDPLEVVVFDVLRVAEAAGGRLERNERRAGDVAVLG